jgi:hypothetical protein
MKKLLILMNVAVLIFGLAGMASAAGYGNNITIYDTVVTGAPGGWYNMGSKPGEDQEVEPNCTPGQRWDMEGFFLLGKTLTMVGGFNFQAGYDGYSGGDIFIGKKGNVLYGAAAASLDGSGNTPTPNVWGYDYVIQMNYAASTYSVFSLTPTSTTLVNVKYDQNKHANPWTYQQGGTEVGGYQGLQMTYDLISDVASGFQGDAEVGGNSHYVVTGLNLGFLPSGDFVVHNTMQCGNDNLMGQVPLPPTVLLLGSGLIGLAGLRYRRRTKG